MKTLDDYPHLHHYTTLDGFRGIVDSGTFRAKNYRFLNDTTEVHHLKERIYKTFSPRVEEIARNRLATNSTKIGMEKEIERLGSIENVVQNITHSLVDSLFTGLFNREDEESRITPYIASFCNHCTVGDEYAAANGLLSMWYGYGRKNEADRFPSGGVAIVFNTLKLDKMLDIELEAFHYFGSLLIESVVYAHDENSFESEFPDFVDTFNEYMLGYFDLPKSMPTTPDFVSVIVRTATRFKHEAFKDEREVRIVACPWSGAYFNAAEKAEATRLVKAVHSLNEAEHIDLFCDPMKRKLPIEKVIIGPSQQQPENKKQVEQVLAKSGYKNVKVTLSETPYKPG